MFSAFDPCRENKGIFCILRAAETSMDICMILIKLSAFWKTLFLFHGSVQHFGFLQNSQNLEFAGLHEKHLPFLPSF